jgi:serine/threonine protein phosphatase PrpC
MLCEDEIVETAKNNAPDIACEKLVETAKKQGGEDNITVIVINCE